MFEMTFTGIVSLRHVSHMRLLEKIHDFTQLAGRSPRLTVCPPNSATFYVVLEVLDNGLVIEIHPHSKTTVAPVDGVYDSVSLF
jgi:hypothetical protein